jgi:aldose 1-epimerase
MLTLTAGTATLLLAPEIGGAIAQWRHGGLPMMRPTSAAALAQARAENNARLLASYPLVPFSNRVANRRFTWNGVTHELPERFGGYAIHGVGWLRPWTVVARGPDTARLELVCAASADWPFGFRAWQDFTLRDDALEVEIGIENQDRQPAPCGIGLHPFFPRSPAATLQFTAGSVWLNGRPGQIPSERTALPAKWDHRDGLPVGPEFIDNCFAGWDGRALLRYPDLGYALRITADKVFGQTVVFVPDNKPFFAVEPVSHMNDGLNRMASEPDHGVFVLAPGEARGGRTVFAVEPI